MSLSSQCLIFVHILLCSIVEYFSLCIKWNIKSRHIRWILEFGSKQISEQQLVGESNRDKDKVIHEFQSRLHSSLNNKNVGLYVKAFMRYVSTMWKVFNIHKYKTILEIFYISFSRKDLSLKECKIDVLLITGMLSPYSTVVEKLHRDVNKERVTLLKIERAGDVLVDSVSTNQYGLRLLLLSIVSTKNIFFSFEL